jgi:hypothetical protein
MKRFFLVLLLALLASPAFAAIQDVKISGDIVSTYIDRQSFDFGLTSGSPANMASLKDQNVFATQTRLRVDADLTDNVSATVGLINERAWNQESSGTDNLDTNVGLYLANVTIRQFLYSPLTITAGRQVFFYGNGMIMGNGSVGENAGGNFHSVAWDLTENLAQDGIKAVLDFKPLTIDMFYIKNSETTPAVEGEYTTNKAQSSNSFGYNINYQLNDPWNTVLEQYMFSRVDGSGYESYVTSASLNKGNSVYAPGLHVTTMPIKGLHISAELAHEFGQQVVTTSLPSTQEVEHRNATAGMLLVNYTLPFLEQYKPSIEAQYMYFSGDKNSGETYSSSSVKSAKSYTAWDTMFAAQAPNHIYNTIFGPTNIEIIAFGGSISPLQDVTASVLWNDLLAAQPYGAQNPMVIIQPNGDVLEPSTTNKSGLGNETDVTLNYAYTEDVSFGLTLGWFVPGDAFSKTNHDTASQALADLAVKF